MKPERRYRDRVNKKLPAVVYTQCMGGTATNGTPDSYYEGNADILWVEWKWTSALNPRKLPNPSPLQDRWLTRAQHNGLRVAVICGSETYAYVLTSNWWWDNSLEFALKLKNVKEVADWIKEQVLR